MAGDLEGMNEVDPNAAGISRPRYYSLDGIRGLAALLVVVFHAAPILNIKQSSGFGLRWLGLVISGFGGIAVAVFFLLSGFLLFGEFVGDLVEQKGRKSFSSYISRRVLRIYPAYWIALISAELLIGPLVGGGFGNFTLSERYFDSQHSFVGITIAWTLSIEISFYLFLPLFVILLQVICRRLMKIRDRLIVVAIGSIFLIVLSSLYRLVIALHYQSDGRLNFLLPQYLGWFALGMLLSVGASALNFKGGSEGNWHLFTRSKPVCWGVALFAYSIAIIVIGNDTLAIFNPAPWWKQEISHLLLGVSALFVLIPATIGLKARTKDGFFSSFIMREVGLVSFGVYLWHDVFLKYFADEINQYSGFGSFLVLLSLIVPVSLLAGWLSYRIIERPALSLSW